MAESVLAEARANIALVKYWGKAPGPGNRPATPSLSLTVDALQTTTRVSLSDADGVSLNGSRAVGAAEDRVIAFLDTWRERGFLKGHVRVESENSFPTGAGLASSASGFAALTTALARLCELDIEPAALSRIARQGSASAARSMFGGIVAFPTGDDPEPFCVLPAGSVRWGMVVCVVRTREKDVSSREGMERTALTSPYYEGWIAQARRDYEAILAAIRGADFPSVGRITEANAIAMHACCMAARPPLVYWNGVTVELIAAARRWRLEGLDAYPTVDAGPNVAFLCPVGQLDDVASRAREVAGVVSTVKGKPGEGPRVVEVG